MFAGHNHVYLHNNLFCAWVWLYLILIYPFPPDNTFLLSTAEGKWSCTEHLAFPCIPEIYLKTLGGCNSNQIHVASLLRYGKSQGIEIYLVRKSNE